MKIKRGEFVSVGDIHLEGLNNLFGEQGNVFILQTIKNAIDYCYENGVTLIVSGGDIFDNPNPSQKAIVGLLQLVLANPKITFCFTLGNHDEESKLKHSSILLDFVSSSQLIPNLKVYTVPTYEEINNIPFYMMPWPCFKQVKRQPHPCINIAHLRLTGAMADNGRKMGKGEAEIDVGSDYWVVWDLHTYQTIGKRITYPGNMYQKNFGEKLPKGLLHSEVVWGNKLKVTHKYVPMEPPFRLINLQVNELADFDTIDDNLDYRYKLFVHKDLVLPTGFLERHPTIIAVNGFKDKIDLAALQNNEINIEELPSLDTKKAAAIKLGTFMKQKGFKKERRERAREIVRRIVEQANA